MKTVETDTRVPGFDACSMTGMFTRFFQGHPGRTRKRRWQWALPPFDGAGGKHGLNAQAKNVRVSQHEPIDLLVRRRFHVDMSERRAGASCPRAPCWWSKVPVPVVQELYAPAECLRGCRKCLLNLPTTRGPRVDA